MFVIDGVEMFFLLAMLESIFLKNRIIIFLLIYKI